MGSLVISFIVGFAAMAVLLGCLKGLNRALKHEKLSGLLVRVEHPRDRAAQPKTVVQFRSPKPVPAKEPARQRVSNATVALVGLAIVLGSRGMPGNTRSSPGKGERTQVSGMQLLGNS